MNYLAKQEFTCGKFFLELHPYLAIPENRFDPYAALQYGADFKLAFSRNAAAGQKPLGILQFIKAQTAVGQHPAGEWCLDVNYQPTSLQDCLFGRSGMIFDKGMYKGQRIAVHGTEKCYMIDTPREIIKYKDGAITGPTLTTFANFIVEIDGPKSRLFPEGITWSYEHTPGAAGGYTLAVGAPRPERIDTPEPKYKFILQQMGITL